MTDRLTLRIANDGSLLLEGEEMTIETLGQRLEEDRANGIDTLIVANASECSEWEAIGPPLELLKRFGRTPIGIVGTWQ